MQSIPTGKILLALSMVTIGALINGVESVCNEFSKNTKEVFDYIIF